MNPPTLRSVLAAVSALIVIAVVGDQMLQLGLASRESLHDVELLDRDGLTRQLEGAANARGRSILLIGDSVLAGDVLAATSADWRNQRVLDFLRSESHADAGTAFHQVAADALLPIDIERILGELDRVDPENHVELLVELNLRQWSPHYREVSGCTRDWICTFPNLAGEVARPALTWPRAVDALRDVTPIWRHRHRFDGSSLLPTLDSRIAKRRAVGPQQQDDLLSRARVEEHYRVDIEADSLQADALDRIVRRLEETGRRALFFATPMHDGFARGIHSEDEQARIYAAMARRIHDAGAVHTRFISFDHPLFAEHHFVDHVHLTPQGCRLLALNLLLELGVRVASAPRSEELAYDYGIDRTLLHGADLAYLDGPAWAALTRGSGGIAFEGESRSLFLAARADHTLRVMRAGLRTLEWLAGAKGKPGDRDGPVAEARFQHPESPVALSGSIYLIDGNGTRIRVLQAGQVSTLQRELQPRLRMLTTDGSALYGLDASGAVWRFEQGRRELVLAAPGPSIELASLAISRDGHVFVADARRIWRGRLPEAGTARVLSDFEEVIRDTGFKNLPKRGSRFPMRLDAVGFSNITALRHVERYSGLLVVDDVEFVHDEKVYLASERAHLRLLDLERGLVYPWLRPMVNANAYFPKIRNAPLRGSYFHQSDIALDPETADLYLLELSRSRLIRIGDGIFGTAQIAHHEASGSSAFGVRSRRETLDNLGPHEFRADRVLAEGMRGQLMGIYVGNSTILFADAFGYYSLVPALERELAARLEPIEQLEVDLFGICEPKADVTKLVTNAITFMQLHFVPDFVVIDINETLSETRGVIKNGKALNALSELARLAQASDFEVVIVDGNGMGADGRDGLRPRSLALRKLFAELRQSGFAVIEPTSQLLVELLEGAPWGNPPYSRAHHHGSPPSIDRTARVLAAQLAPRLAAGFERRGQRDERDPLIFDKSRRGGLRALIRGKGDAPFRALPDVPRSVAQIQIRGTRLEVVIDKGKLDELDVSIPASQLGMASAIKTFVVEDVRGALVDAMRVRFVRFSNYDEYGQGTMEGATPLYQDEVTRDSLGRFYIK